MNQKRMLNLLLAFVLLVQCTVPVLAAEEFTGEGQTPEVSCEEAVPEGEDAAPASDEEQAALPAQEPTEEQTEEPTEEQTQAEPLPVLTQEAPSPVEPESVPEEQPSETAEEPTAQAAEEEPAQQEAEAAQERLYNGFEADYNDPQFVKLLQQGFFDEDDGDEPLRSMTSYQHNSRFNGYEITKGVDVSKWNNITDWERAKRAGVDFAIIRCGNRFSDDGSLGSDVLFDRNMRDAQKAGVKTGVYFFSQAVSEREAVEEANYTLKLVKGYTFPLPIVFDYEYYENGRLTRARLSQSERTNICKAFCKTIEDAGYPAMVYANRDMLTNDMYGEELVKAGYEVWLAEWNTNPKYTGTYTYWQYSDSGYYNGFDHKVDVNFRYRLPDAKITRINSMASGVRIEWGKVSPAKGYRVYRKVSGNDWKLLGTVTGNTNLFYIDKTVTDGGKYTYAVQPYDGYIDGEYENSASAVTYHKMTALDTATAVNNGIRLHWTNSGAYDSYILYRRAKGTKPWTKLATVKGSEKTYLDTSRFQSGSAWNYTIVGVKNGKRDTYDPYGIDTLWLAVPKLTGISPETMGIQVQWGKVNGAALYRIYRRSGNEAWKAVGNAKTLSFMDKTAVSGREYTYTVRAFSGSYYGGYDAAGMKGMYLATPKLSFVSSQNGGKQIALAWTAVTGASKYRIYRKSSEKGSWQLISWTKHTSYVDSNVSKGGTYLYTVRAMTNYGDQAILSGFQSGVSATWLDIPVLTPVNNSVNSIQVNWKKVSGAKQYDVYRKTAGTGWKKLATVKNAFFYLDKKPVIGTVNYYTVRAVSGKIVSGFEVAGSAGICMAAPALKTPVQCAKGIQLSWSGVSGAQRYRIFRKSASNESWTGIGWSNTTSFVDSTATDGKNYIYTVRAFASVRGRGVYSRFLASGVSIFKLAQPALLTADWTEEGVQVVWGAVARAQEYRVYRRTDTGTWSMIAVVSDGGSYLDRDAERDTVYYYTVRAVWGTNVSWYDAAAISPGLPATPEPPTEEPSEPSEQPSGEPVSEPSEQPSGEPASEPSQEPVEQTGGE